MEPIEIIKAFAVLFDNIFRYLWYNLTYLWEIIDATLRFSEGGVLYGLSVIFYYTEFFANDYDGFVILIQDNIWGIAGAVLFWPIFVAWIVFKWLFGL